MKFVKNIDWISRHEQTFSKIKKVQQHRISNETAFVVKKVKSPGDVADKKLKSIQAKSRLFRRGVKKDFICDGSFQEAITPVLVLAQVFALMPVSGITSKSAQSLLFSFKNFRTINSIFVIICFGVCTGFTINWALRQRFDFDSVVLVLAQVFALMPVSGITSKSAQSLLFSFKNFRTINSIFVIICFGVCTGFTINWALRQRFDFDSVETIIFYTSIFLIAVSFFNLARKWPQLMTEWESVERKLPPLRSQLEKRSLAHKIKMIAFVTSMLSLVEHLLSMLSSIYYANACPARPDPIESYLYSNFIQIFTFVKYTNWLGMFGKYLNVLSTFAWNFTDIFIMAISVGLSARFRQLNGDLFEMARKPTTEAFWINSRVNYRNLCKLCDKVDDAVSSITLLGFSNNLYFICGKIMKSIQKKPSFTHTLYFWFSLFYLLGRTLALSLYSADIHDESRRPMQVFRAVPRESWCKEIKRFSQEVSTDVVALSGMKFFHLTRGLVLSVAGTIVTYELVLLQFNKQDSIGDCS